MQCRCGFNYTGSYCEAYKYVTKPFFAGASYLRVDAGGLTLRDGVQVRILYYAFTI